MRPHHWAEGNPESSGHPRGPKLSNVSFQMAIFYREQRLDLRDSHPLFGGPLPLDRFGLGWWSLVDLRWRGLVRYGWRGCIIIGCHVLKLNVECIEQNIAHPLTLSKVGTGLAMSAVLENKFSPANDPPTTLASFS